MVINSRISSLEEFVASRAEKISGGKVISSTVITDSCRERENARDITVTCPITCKGPPLH